MTTNLARLSISMAVAARMAAVAINIIAAIVLFVLGTRLHDATVTALLHIGPVPEFSLQGVQTLLTVGQPIDRLINLGIAWAAGIGAIACYYLALIGAHRIWCSLTSGLTIAARIRPS